MDDKIWLGLLGVVFLVLQFIFRSNTGKIVGEAVKTFDIHVTESTEIHTMVASLVKFHDVKDSEGRPMMYMPPSMITTQHEIVKILHVLTQTQKATVAILERLERKVDKEK